MLRANEEDGACKPNLIYELARMCVNLTFTFNWVAISCETKSKGREEKKRKEKKKEGKRENR